MYQMVEDKIFGMGFIGLEPGRLYKIGQSPKLKDQTASGNPLLLNSAEAPLTALTIYGHSTQDGTPSPDNPVPIVNAGESGNITVEARGKNLLQLQDGRGGNRGVEVTCRNGEISLVGTATETGWTILKVNPPVVLNGDYALSANNDVECCLINNDYKTVINTSKPQNIVNGEVTKIAFNVIEGKIYNMNGIKVMLNRGLTASPYEPPRIPQSLTLQTPNGLPGIPVSKDGNYTDSDGQQWICDEIDLARGKYVQRVGKTVVDGTEIKFTATSTGAYWNLPHRSAPGISEIRIAISKYFPINVILGNIEYSFLFTIPKLMSPYFSLVDELNAFCAEKYADGQPLEIYYIMAPIETDLPAEEIDAYKALHTYSPTTTVSNDAGAWMKVGYKTNKL